MVISDTHKFVFIHIPKSGGTSCAEALKQVIPDRDVHHWGNSKRTKHETYLQLEERTDPAGSMNNRLRALLFNRRIQLENYVKFAFVRNPWDRMVSHFFYMKQNDIAPEIEKVNTFEDYLNALDRKEPWIHNRYATKTQYEYIINSSGKVITDFIGRYETLENDFNKITEKINVNATLPHLNQSVRNTNYKSYYTTEARKIVERRFDMDISFFKYTF